jgi:hypothetical protein
LLFGTSQIVLIGGKERGYICLAKKIKTEMNEKEEKYKMLLKKFYRTSKIFHFSDIYGNE